MIINKNHIYLFFFFLLYQFIGLFDNIYCLGVYFIVLLFLLYKNNILEDIRFKKFNISKMNKILWGFPIFYLIIVNLINKSNIIEDLLFWGLVVLIEEIFFRGCLLYLFKNMETRKQILFSSLIFSIFHLNNIISNDEYLFVMFQVVLSFFVGISFCIITIICDSIFPAYLIHFIINITNNINLTNKQYIYFSIFIIIICIYNHYLYKILINERS